MGRTKTSLTVLVDEAWFEHPAIQGLIEKGHTVWAMRDPYSYLESLDVDIILSRRAHWWSYKMFSNPAYLNLAIKTAQARKKETKNEK